MDALTKGTEYGREDGHLVDIWNQLGTYMQDRKQWAKALHAHQRALALAEARGIETLACTSHISYLSAFLCEWDEEHKQRPRLLKSLTAMTQQLPVPPLPKEELVGRLSSKRSCGSAPASP